jgi:hypothetical protein
MSDRAAWLEQRCPECRAAPGAKPGVSDTATIKLLRSAGERLVDVERWTFRELCYVLEAPVWVRFGTFIGHPQVRGEVVWSADDRCVVIRGRRGERRFEEQAG